MFPVKLDNANVIEYSDKFNFGNIGGSSCSIFYFAICRYDKEERYYLFYCDENKEVIFDDLLESIDECKYVASQYGTVTWKKL